MHFYYLCVFEKQISHHLNLVPVWFLVMLKSWKKMAAFSTFVIMWSKEYPPAIARCIVETIGIWTITFYQICIAANCIFLQFKCYSNPKRGFFLRSQTLFISTLADVKQNIETWYQQKYDNICNFSSIFKNIN